MKANLVIFALLLGFSSFGQSDSSKKYWKLSGYLEAYFGVDADNGINKIRPSFLYSYNRNRQLNLNLGFVKWAFDNNKIRSNVALMAGTYSTTNLSAEPGFLKNVFEANIGIKLARIKNLWLDAGVFPSHIGFESAIGKDCWTLSRSVLAENSPYYESGIKLSFITNDEKWTLTALLLNGWQHIKPPSGNTSLAFGHQVVYKPNDKILFNSSSFIGVDAPDSAKVLRLFHNLYSQIQASERVGFIIGLDLGAQQKIADKSRYDLWVAPIVMTRLRWHKKFHTALRAEYYSDPENVIINKSTFGKFNTYGFSINADYQIFKNTLWRIEARTLRSKNNIFEFNNGLRKFYNSFTTSVALSF